MSYLFAAFCAVWIILFLFFLSLSRRQRELSREVESLRRMIEQKGSSRPS
jgi:CcmD family protein